MDFIEEFKCNILGINDESIVDSSLAAFDFQYRSCSVYREYCEYLKIDPKQVKSVHDIPFLPIEFFKNHIIKSQTRKESKVFKSSGTTSSNKSKHYIFDLDHYRETSRRNFEENFGPLPEQTIIALLPSYQEQGDSSLIDMVDYFISHAKNKSGYFLEGNISEILQSEDRKIVIGVAYALLDVSQEKISTRNTVIIETGGMKGRKKEMTRPELHFYLKNGFKVDKIWSEYGMTELLTQAYAKNGHFKFPGWAKCLIRDVNDPFHYKEDGKTGGINVIDLANIDTCCFIETMDLGRAHKDTFEVLGRFDNSDIRGCNLMI